MTAFIKDKSFHPVCTCEEEENSVCDNALDKFVHRILLSATMNDKESDKFGIVGDDDGKLVSVDYKRKPRINGNKIQERYEKSLKNRTNRKKEARRNKWEKSEKVEDMPRGTVQQVNGKVYVNVPIEVYRKMVEAEIDCKMKQVQDYHEYHSRRQDDLRLEAMRATVYWKECTKRLEVNMSIAYRELERLNEAYECTKALLCMYEAEDSKLKMQPRKEKHKEKHKEKKKIKDTTTDSQDGPGGDK